MNIALWSLRVLLVASAGAKLFFPSSGTSGVMTTIGMLELLAVASTFAAESASGQAILATFSGFVGAAAATLLLTVLDPASGSASCGCFGRAIELRRDQALI